MIHFIGCYFLCFFDILSIYFGRSIYFLIYNDIKIIKRNLVLQDFMRIFINVEVFVSYFFEKSNDLNDQSD